jgi:hypothetical protein
LFFAGKLVACLPAVRSAGRSASVPGTTRIRYNNGRAAKAAEAREWKALIYAGRYYAFSE